MIGVPGASKTARGTFAVVDVGNDGKIADLALICHSFGNLHRQSSSQSPLTSVSACGENCGRSLARPLPQQTARRTAPCWVCRGREISKSE